MKYKNAEDFLNKTATAVGVARDALEDYVQSAHVADNPATVLAEKLGLDKFKARVILGTWRRLSGFVSHKNDKKPVFMPANVSEAQRFIAEYQRLENLEMDLEQKLTKVRAEKEKYLPAKRAMESLSAVVGKIKDNIRSGAR